MKDKLLDALNKCPIDVNELYELIPEVRYLSECESYGEHHQFDVLTHTIKAIEYVNNNYDGKDKYILQVTLLLHDIGKKDSLAYDNNKIHFSGHNEKSIDISLPILHRLQFSESEIKLIIALIDYHDKPVNHPSIMKSLCRYFGHNFIDLLTKVKIADISNHKKEYSEKRMSELTPLISFSRCR